MIRFHRKSPHHYCQMQRYACVHDSSWPYRMFSSILNGNTFLWRHKLSCWSVCLFIYLVLIQDLAIQPRMTSIMKFSCLCLQCASITIHAQPHLAITFYPVPSSFRDSSPESHASSFAGSMVHLYPEKVLTGTES